VVEVEVVIQTLDQQHKGNLEDLVVVLELDLEDLL
tara:strand:- start:243 stop:347 length:105 start_codon:yes stop_codon:yes gene_type:complete